MCFKPILNVAGNQFYMAFNLPTLPTGLSLQLYLTPGNSSAQKISTSINFLTKQTVTLTSDTTATSDSNIQASTNYILTMSVSKDTMAVASQIVSMKNKVLAQNAVQVNNYNLIYSLRRDAYLLCFGLQGSTSRNIKVTRSAAVQLMYYGASSNSLIGNSTSIISNPSTTLPTHDGTPSGALLGAVLGSVFGFLLLCAVVFIIVYEVILCRSRSKNNKSTDPESPSSQYSQVPSPTGIELQSNHTGEVQHNAINQ
ncbi:hypothetical protein AKO1_014560 [Acrasis kona]|uniref:Uncharacterized protein n=1 Tax=Acrasis kona TaxID=1008807 RepID=A0AAW2Z2B5_9EUKA